MMINKIIILSIFLMINGFSEDEKSLVVGWTVTWFEVDILPTKKSIIELKNLKDIEKKYGNSTFYTSAYLPKSMQIDSYRWFLVNKSKECKSFWFHQKYQGDTLVKNWITFVSCDDVIKNRDN